MALKSIILSASCYNSDAQLHPLFSLINWLRLYNKKLPLTLLKHAVFIVFIDIYVSGDQFDLFYGVFYDFFTNGGCLKSDSCVESAPY